jgi:phage N-6-adenine-methyltransferase
MLNSSLFSSAKDDWETPDFLFDSLNKEFGFTLDPCCLPHSAKCSHYFTPDDDGLAQEWFGVVFMNPPYGREIGRWVRKAFEQSNNGSVVVCLIPARTDTRWWHSYCMKSKEIRFLTKRLTFKGGTNKATFPAAIVVFDKSGSGSPQLSAYKI